MNWPLFFELLTKIGRGLAWVGEILQKLYAIVVSLFFSAVCFIAMAIFAHLVGFNILRVDVQIVIGVISVPLGFCLTYLQIRSDLHNKARDDDDRTMTM